MDATDELATVVEATKGRFARHTLGNYRVVDFAMAGP
jgi:hypothetical protein